MKTVKQLRADGTVVRELPTLCYESLVSVDHDGIGTWEQHESLDAAIAAASERGRHEVHLVTTDSACMYRTRKPVWPTERDSYTTSAE